MSLTPVKHFFSNIMSRTMLIVNEMMRSALYQTNMLGRIFIVLAHWNNSLWIDTCISLCRKNLSTTCPKAKIWKKNYIYSNKFFHNFHLYDSSFTCPMLQASGLERRQICRCIQSHYSDSKATSLYSTFKWCMISEEAAHEHFIVFGFTCPGLV